MYVKSEIEQKDASLNVSLHHPTLQDDSLFTSNNDPVCDCELPQWDIKPDLNLKYDVPSSTSDITIGSQHPEKLDQLIVPRNAMFCSFFFIVLTKLETHELYYPLKRSVGLSIEMCPSSRVMT